MCTISSHHLSYVSEKGAPGFPGPETQRDSVPGPLGVCGGQLMQVCPKWPASEGEWPPSRVLAAVPGVVDGSPLLA